MTKTIREAYEQAFSETIKAGVPETQRHMVACLAVKDAMEDTTENLIALRDVMKNPHSPTNGQGMTTTPDWIDRLIERETHSDTMKPLSPLERQWLEDWRRHFEPTKNPTT